MGVTVFSVDQKPISKRSGFYGLGFLYVLYCWRGLSLDQSSRPPALMSYLHGLYVAFKNWLFIDYQWAARLFPRLLCVPPLKKTNW